LAYYLKAEKDQLFFSSIIGIAFQLNINAIW